MKRLTSMVLAWGCLASLAWVSPACSDADTPGGTSGGAGGTATAGTGGTPAAGGSSAGTGGTPAAGGTDTAGTGGTPAAGGTDTAGTGGTPAAGGAAGSAGDAGTGGGFAGGAAGMAGAGGAGASAECQEYCTDIAAACTEDFTQFESEAECLTACAAYPTDGMEEATSGDSIQCRLTHLGYVVDPGTRNPHCGHAGPTGAGQCA